MGLSPILPEIQPVTIDTMVNNNVPLLNIGLNFVMCECSLRVTLVLAFDFLLQNFGRWQGPMNDTLSFYECRFSGGDTMRWWGNSNPTSWKITCLNFLLSQAVGMHKLWVRMLAPCHCLHPDASDHGWATWWNLHYLIFSSVVPIIITCRSFRNSHRI